MDCIQQLPLYSIASATFIDLLPQPVFCTPKHTHRQTDRQIHARARSHSLLRMHILFRACAVLKSIQRWTSIVTFTIRSKVRTNLKFPTLQDPVWVIDLCVCKINETHKVSRWILFFSFSFLSFDRVLWQFMCVVAYVSELNSFSECCPSISLFFSRQRASLKTFVAASFNRLNLLSTAVFNGSLKYSHKS